MKFLRDLKVSSPHPEERPAGPRLEGWQRAPCLRPMLAPARPPDEVVVGRGSKRMKFLRDRKVRDVLWQAARDRGDGRGRLVLRAERLGQHGEGGYRVGLPASCGAIPASRCRSTSPATSPPTRSSPCCGPASSTRCWSRSPSIAVATRDRLHRGPAAAVAQLAALDPGRLLHRVRAQHPAAVLRAVLVFRRARRPAGAAREPELPRRRLPQPPRPLYPDARRRDGLSARPARDPAS